MKQHLFANFIQVNFFIKNAGFMTNYMEFYINMSIFIYIIK